MRQSPNELHKSVLPEKMGILNYISNYIEVHTQNPEIKRRKQEFFSHQALIFSAGLQEPLGFTIRAITNLTVAIHSGRK